jgi:NTE family protein
LSALPIFGALDAATLNALAESLEWFSLPGGWRLFSQGDPGDALYIVTSGRLAIMVEALNRSELVAELGPGDTVGEMALVSGEPRMGTAVAVRDTELLCLAKSAFDRLVEHHPRILKPIATLLVERLRRTTRRASPLHAPRTLALIPLDALGPCTLLTTTLAQAFERMKLKVRALDCSAAGLNTEWYHAVETADDLTLYQGEAAASPWTRLCIRQADRVLLVAATGGMAEAASSVQPLLEGRPARSVDLVIVETTAGAARLPPLAKQIEVHLRHRVRFDRGSDIARLARLLTNRAIGLVLSGGGARGLAHIGVIRALRSAGLPIDLVGGTSMGAIVGAGLALEWDDGELRERMRDAFVGTGPLRDLAVPLIAFFKGRNVTRLLRKHFGEARIEDLHLPYFCVSSNLTTGETMVHRTGALWRAIRASLSIPGMLPPVVEKGDVLVDGGVLNNLPVDIMRAIGRGSVVGVDVAANRALASANIDLETASWWRLLRADRRRVPWLLSTLIRAGTVSSDAQAASNQHEADIVITPPLEQVELLDWSGFDHIVELGYRHTMTLIERTDASPIRQLVASAG